METDDPAAALVATAWLRRFQYEQPKVPVLSHYTNVDGLLGICSSNSLWATCAQYSNDISEVIYAQSVAHKVVEDVFRPHVKDASLDILRIIIERVIGEKGETGDAYIISFCGSTDLLSQWRAYGKDAGFEIRFHPLSTWNAQEDVEIIALNAPHITRTLLVKVEYDENQQRAMLRNLLEGVLEIIHDVQMKNPEVRGIHSAAATLTVFEVTQWLYSIKHPAFEEEQEWRVIAFPELTKLSFGGEYVQPEILRFRPGRHSLVPYIELIPANGKLPITEIICGPGGHHRLTAKAVRLLVSSKGFHEVAVRNSAVPLVL